jgi:type II secretory pathway component GspD/PulD (secretin)
MVFIRPRILRDSGDASTVTSGKYEELRERQEEQSEEPVRLMREETHPQLEPLPNEAPTAPGPVPAAPAPSNDGDEP